MSTDGHMRDGKVRVHKAVKGSTAWPRAIWTTVGGWHLASRSPAGSWWQANQSRRRRASRADTATQNSRYAVRRAEASWADMAPVKRSPHASSRSVFED